MTNRRKLVMGLIISSLLGVFILQVYYGWRVYRQHALDLQKEVNTSLKEAVQVAKLHRIDRVNEYFKQHIRDSSLSKIELRNTEEGPRVFFVNQTNGRAMVSLVFNEQLDLNKIDSSNLAKLMEKRVLEHNKSLLKDGSIFYWTEEIGEKLKVYNDTIRIAMPYLTQQMHSQLESYGIAPDFEFVLLKDSTNTMVLPTPKYSLVSDTLSAKLPQHSKVAVALHNPHYEVLQRSGLVMLLTVLVLLLIITSFWVLIRVLAQQRKLSKLKDDFIDNVTHELLTPVTTLQLALDSLSNNGSIPQPNKYLELSKQQAQRIAEVVDHVLQISFVDEVQPGLMLESIWIEDFLTEVLAYHQITVHKPVQLIFQPTTRHEVWSDRQHLANVFHNVIGNAIKYGPACEAIVIIVIEARKHHLSIQITDNGSGIAPAEKERIFEKFHRVNTTNTHEVKGLGIGLYYTRGILRQLKGDIQLTQSSAQGSTFEITLPLTST